MCVLAGFRAPGSEIRLSGSVYGKLRFYFFDLGVWR